jgi:hypothetical protein
LAEHEHTLKQEMAGHTVILCAELDVRQHRPVELIERGSLGNLEDVLELCMSKESEARTGQLNISLGNEMCLLAEPRGDASNIVTDDI